MALTGILFVLKTKYVELRVGDGPSLFGVGIAGSIMTASFRAILGGVNRHVAAGGRVPDAVLQASA